MLGNEVTRQRVKTASEEAGGEEVNEWTNTECPNQYNIKYGLSSNVEVMPRSQRLRPHKGRSQSIEEDLECGKENFPEDVVQTNQFKARGKVCIDAIFAHLLVVLKVVSLRDEQRVMSSCVINY